LRWPLASPKVVSRYGMRWGAMHGGIDLKAAVGTPVYAAQAGRVLYAGDAVRGYGIMVVIEHSPDLVTVYAHNSVLLVKTSDRVTAGQVIAHSGQSGRATGPHLHFEVRSGDSTEDPLDFLPPI
jgi:murein DD-endopeptidase MepM/ murein hydrolase activator NlpD